jgi:hypothetical protein
MTTQRASGPRPTGRSGLLSCRCSILAHGSSLALAALWSAPVRPALQAIRPIALGRKNALFAGSDGGARHWAIVTSLVATAKLNGVEPLAWLTDVLERMVSRRTKAHELARLLPWTWKAQQLTDAVEA